LKDSTSRTQRAERLIWKKGVMYGSRRNIDWLGAKPTGRKIAIRMDEKP
jgi:hypothetical protein